MKIGKNSLETVLHDPTYLGSINQYCDKCNRIMKNGEKYVKQRGETISGFYYSDNYCLKCFVEMNEIYSEISETKYSKEEHERLQRAWNYIKYILGEWELASRKELKEIEEKGRENPIKDYRDEMKETAKLETIVRLLDLMGGMEKVF